MKLLLILLFLVSAINSGCSIFCVRGNGETIQTKRELDEFNEIETDGDFDIEIIKNANYSAQVEAESNLQPEIVTEVVNKKLIIKNKECISPTSAIKIYVYTKNLKALLLNGAGNMQCKDTFTSETFSLKINGAGDIFALTKTAKLDAVINGAGDISLEGKTNTLNIKINGSGDVKAFGLATKNSSVKINGAGDAEVIAELALDAKIFGSGNIYYKGTNPSVHSKITGAGEVIKK